MPATSAGMTICAIPPSIRPAMPADIPANTRIYARAVSHGTGSFEFEPPDEADMAARMQALRGDGFPYYVAEFDSAVVGYAYASQAVGYKFGRWLDTPLMQRAAGKGTATIPQRRVPGAARRDSGELQTRDPACWKANGARNCGASLRAAP